jgi:HD-like signal output (HDOD) protein/prolyl-tRNA editing enzyme YbaK/EbsC (Cys-tRNA(Pro) deacylase)
MVFDMLEPKKIPSNIIQKSAVCDYLNTAGVNYMVIENLPNHTLEEIIKLIGIADHALLRVALMQDELGIILAILPQDYLLDIGLLSKQLNRELQPLDNELLNKMYSEVNIDCYPPLPEFLSLPCVIESDILNLEDVYFKPGVSNELICMKRSAFMEFQQQSKRYNFGIAISHLPHLNNPEGGVSVSIKQLTPLRIKKRVEQTIELPAVPVIASKILKLRFDPNATSKDLAQVIEKDPSLSAQLMSWASSPYYGYSGKLSSIECAIVKVLGFDLVMNLALGIVLGRSMHVPVQGPLGLSEYWRFSICTAALVETLVNLMPIQHRPIPGIAYLAGLLHNFGILLLAQVFPPHYQLLNRYVLANPHINLTTIENYVLGVGHDQIGAWLMKAWHLPPEVIAAAKFHHHEEYTSEYAVYSNIVLLATRLLKTHGIGDAEDSTIPLPLLEFLHLTEEEAHQALDYVISQREDLFLLASQIVPS